jgi:hypothetical protein
MKTRGALRRRYSTHAGRKRMLPQSGGRIAQAEGMIRCGDRLTSCPPLPACGDLHKKFQQSTFGAHFVEVGVDAATAEIRVRRMLAVCAAGRILTPKTARSQVIGAMTMGDGAALMVRSTTPPACACAIIRSRSTSSSTGFRTWDEPRSCRATRVHVRRFGSYEKYEPI